MKHLLQRAVLAVGLAALLAAILTALVPQVRAAWRTTLFIAQVMPSIPLKPQEWITRPPDRQEVLFPTPTGHGRADLYVPFGAGRRSAVLLFLGVNPAGRDDPRVVSLAQGLARNGTVVMIPWSDSMAQGRIRLGDIEDLVWAFQYLRGLAEVDPERVGMGGFCVGASLATVAAQDPRIRDAVKFINFFGGYFDAVDLVRAISSRTRFYNGQHRPWEPDALTQQVFTTHLIEGVAAPGDRETLARMFITREVSTGESSLLTTDEGRAVHALLTGPDMTEVGGLLARLSPETLGFLRAISPSTHIDQLHARVLIMHDTSDRLVPSEESRRLAEALGHDPRTFHTELSLFQGQVRFHESGEAGLGILDYIREASKFYLHMYNIVRELA